MMLPNLPALAQEYKPPAIVQSVYNQIDKIQAEIKAEEERIAAEAIRLAQEEAERKRIEAVWLAHPAGNDYTPYNCTWGVANWIKVPSGLGNANQWYARAQAWGFNVGLEPRAGAVGVDTRGRWGHVVLVLRVNADGSITVKEQNYDYRGSVRIHTMSAIRFKYIYL